VRRLRLFFSARLRTSSRSAPGNNKVDFTGHATTALYVINKGLSTGMWSEFCYVIRLHNKTVVALVAEID